MRRRQWRFLLAFGGFLLTAPNRLWAQELDRGDVTDLVVTALRYLTDVHLNSRYSSPVLRVVDASDEVRAYLTFDPSELASAVGQGLGVPVRHTTEDRFCDLTRSRPYWRMRNADLSMSAYLVEVSQQEAQVSLGYTGGSLLAGSTSRTLHLERSPEGWVARQLDPRVLHGSSTSCRPDPPPSMTAQDLAQMLAAAILPLIETPPVAHPGGAIGVLCLNDMFDGWTKDVIPVLSTELERRGVPTDEGCQFPEGREEDGFRAPTGEPAAGILLHHVVFESPNRALVQLRSSVKSDPHQTESERLNQVQQCTVERTAAGWSRTSCEPVEWSMRYPVLIKGG